MASFSSYDKYREHVRIRNERILTQLGEGKRVVDLAKDYGLSDSTIRQLIKKVAEDGKRRAKWGPLSVRLVKVMEKKFNFRSLQDFLASPITEDEFLSTRGVGGISLREINIATGKFSMNKQQRKSPEIF